MEKLVTIERFILDNQPEHAGGEFTNLLYDIALSAKVIAAKTTRAGLVDILGQAGTINVQGEDQQKLDVYADQVVFRLNDHTGRLCVMASEEHEDILGHRPRSLSFLSSVIPKPVKGILGRQSQAFIGVREAVNNEQAVDRLPHLTPNFLVPAGLAGNYRPDAMEELR